MKLSLLKLFLFGVVSIGLASCTNDPSAVGNNKIPDTGDFPFSITPLWSWTTYDGYLSTGAITSDREGGYTERFENRGAIYNSSGNYTTANSIVLNGATLPSTTARAYFNEVSQTYNTYHVWDVTGNSNVSTFKDSVLAPSKFRVTFPHHLSDSASKSGLTVTYQNPGTDSVYIFFTYNALLSRALDATVDTNYYSAQAIALNTGSYTVSGGLLSGFPSKGVLMVTVVAANQKSVAASGRNYLLSAVSAANVNAFIKP